MCQAQSGSSDASGTIALALLSALLALPLPLPTRCDGERKDIREEHAAAVGRMKRGPEEVRAQVR